MSHSALSSIFITSETAMFTDVAVLYFNTACHLGIDKKEEERNYTSRL
jgi:hypothetical protein